LIPGIPTGSDHHGQIVNDDGMVGQEYFVSAQDDSGEGLHDEKTDQPICTIPQGFSEGYGGFERALVSVQDIAPQFVVVVSFVAIVAR
jgi:hypothetical protein